MYKSAIYTVFCFTVVVRNAYSVPVVNNVGDAIYKITKDAPVQTKVTTNTYQIDGTFTGQIGMTYGTDIPVTGQLHGDATPSRDPEYDYQLDGWFTGVAGGKQVTSAVTSGYYTGMLNYFDGALGYAGNLIPKKIATVAPPTNKQPAGIPMVNVIPANSILNVLPPTTKQPVGTPMINGIPANSILNMAKPIPPNFKPLTPNSFKPLFEELQKLFVETQQKKRS